MISSMRPVATSTGLTSWCLRSARVSACARTVAFSSAPVSFSAAIVWRSLAIVWSKVRYRASWSPMISHTSFAAGGMPSVGAAAEPDRRADEPGRLVARAVGPGQARLDGPGLHRTRPVHGVQQRLDRLGDGRVLPDQVPFRSPGRPVGHGDRGTRQLPSGDIPDVPPDALRHHVE